MRASTKYSDKPHARIYQHWWQYPAWRTLSPIGRSILLAFLVEYRKGKNFIEMSDKRASAMGNCSRNSANKAIHELCEKGWIGVARVGKTKGPRKGRCSAYYLTMYAEDIGIRPEHGYKKWKVLSAQN